MSTPPPQHPPPSPPPPSPTGYHQPYPAAPFPPPPAGTNGFSVAALVLGILVAPLGIVFGIVALVQIGRKGQKGRGLAFAGIAVGGLSVILSVTLFAFGATLIGERHDGTPDGTVEKSAFSLDKGDCFNHSAEWDTEVHDVKAISCDAPHNAEVAGEVDLYGRFEDAYPGEARLSKTADAECTEIADAYSLDTWALPADLYYAYYLPTPRSWAFGDRTVSCFYVKKTGELTESVRADDATLDEDQLAYLRAVNLLNNAYADSPEAEYVDDDLPGYKKWAERVADAVDEEERRLSSHEWPAHADKQVTALADSLAKAEVQWREAAKATNVDTYWSHYQKAEALLGTDLAAAARKQLGLAHQQTSPSASESGTDV